MGSGHMHLPPPIIDEDASGHMHLTPPIIDEDATASTPNTQMLFSVQFPSIIAGNYAAPVACPHVEDRLADRMEELQISANAGPPQSNEAGASLVRRSNRFSSLARRNSRPFLGRLPERRTNASASTSRVQQGSGVNKDESCRNLQQMMADVAELASGLESLQLNVEENRVELRHMNEEGYRMRSLELVPERNRLRMQQVRAELRRLRRVMVQEGAIIATYLTYDRRRLRSIRRLEEYQRLLVSLVMLLRERAANYRLCFTYGENLTECDVSILKRAYSFYKSEVKYGETLLHHVEECLVVLREQS